MATLTGRFAPAPTVCARRSRGGRWTSAPAMRTPQSTHLAFCRVACAERPPCLIAFVSHAPDGAPNRLFDCSCGSNKLPATTRSSTNTDGIAWRKGLRFCVMSRILEAEQCVHLSDARSPTHRRQARDKTRRERRPHSGTSNLVLGRNSRRRPAKFPASSKVYGTRRPRVRESVAKGAGEAPAASGRRSPHLEVMWKAHQILLHHRFAFIKPKHWPLWESRV